MASSASSPGGRGYPRSRGSLGPTSTREERRRSYSQNFLRDATAVSRFLQLADLSPGPLCVEIGAGDGALTTRLAGLYDRLIAYEIDAAHAARLGEQVAGQPNVEVVLADFTRVRPPREPFQAVGNVPFGITSAIVDWCLDAKTLTSATMITQLEYARKRTGDYGRWSKATVLSWPEFSWQLQGAIPRTAFRPMPRVNAGVLRIARRPRPYGPRSTLAEYRHMVEVGFQGLGGSLFASLSRAFPRDRVLNAFQEAGIARDTIVAFVHPDAWWELFCAISPRTPAPAPARRAAAGPREAEPSFPPRGSGRPAATARAKGEPRQTRPRGRRG